MRPTGTRAHGFAAALTLGSIALGSIALGSIALAAPAGAAGGSQIIDCTGKSVTKPKEIVVTCADAGVSVTGINWSSWTANGAKGTGTLVWNTCLPETCVAGIVEKYRVRITLGNLASAPGLSVFSGMTLTFPKNGPAGANTATYILDNPQR